MNAELSNLVDDQEAQLTRRQATIEQLEDDLDDANKLSENRQLYCEKLELNSREKDSKLNRQSVAIRDIEDRAKDLKDSLEQKLVECNKLKVEVANKDKALTAKDCEIRQSHSALSAKDDKLAEKDNALAAKDEEIARLKSHNDKLTDERDHFQRAAQEAGEELQDITTRTVELKGQVAEALLNISKKDTEIAGWKRERRKILKEKGDFQREVVARRKENTQLLRESFPTLQRTIKGLEEENERLKAELKEVHERDKAIIARLRNERDKLSDLSLTLQHLDGSLPWHKNKFRRSLSMVKETLENEVQRLRQQNHLQKLDVQHLYLGKKQDEGLYADVNERFDATRAELIQVRSQLSELQCKYEQSQTLMLEIRNAFKIDLNSFPDPERRKLEFIKSMTSMGPKHACNMVVSHIMAKYDLKDRLDDKLAKQAEKIAKLQESLNKEESELDMMLFSEASRLHEVERLQSEVRILSDMNRDQRLAI
jgi:chromosome segregation ATPase